MPTRKTTRLLGMGWGLAAGGIGATSISWFIGTVYRDGLLCRAVDRETRGGSDIDLRDAGAEHPGRGWLDHVDRARHLAGLDQTSAHSGDDERGEAYA